MGYDEILGVGRKRLKESSVAICSIVRDCNANLTRNIPVVEKLRVLCGESKVIVFENDSIDGTKQTLLNWQQQSNGVAVTTEDYNQQTIPSSNKGVNRFFSASRIGKMAGFRNKYLEQLEQLNWEPDFVIIIDLDIKQFSIEGILHSIGLADYWDVVTAFGYAKSLFGGLDYYDTYALAELGDEYLSQTEQSIDRYQSKWGNLNKDMPLMAVYSAYGGLSIYKYQAIKNCRYSVVSNDDDRVEVRCEHFSLCQQIRDKGFDRIFVNPGMQLKYQGVNIDKLIRFIKRDVLRLSMK